MHVFLFFLEPCKLNLCIFLMFFVLFTHYTLCKIFHQPPSSLRLSVSVSTGVADKELAFMHEEGIRDPSVCLCEDKKENTEQTSGGIISRTTDALKRTQDY